MIHKLDAVRLLQSDHDVPKQSNAFITDPHDFCNLRVYSLLNRYELYLANSGTGLPTQKITLQASVQ